MRKRIKAITTKTCRTRWQWLGVVAWALLGCFACLGCQKQERQASQRALPDLRDLPRYQKALRARKPPPSRALRPQEREKLILLHLNQLMGGKGGEGSRLLQAVLALSSSPTIRREALPLLARQLRWESGRRACHLLVALARLSQRSPHGVGALLPSPSPTKRFRIQSLRCDPHTRLQAIQLNRVDLSEAQLSHVNLANAQLQRSDLTKARLQETNLNQGQLQQANLHEADLSKSNLTLANLQGARLQSANLQGALLLGAGLQNVDARRANLKGADLFGARLQKANFQRADLRHARLANARLDGIRMRGARLEGALFSASGRAQLRRSQANTSNAVCLMEQPATACYRWHRSSPRSQPPPAGCPGQLQGPIFAYSRDDQRRLSRSQRRALARQRCPWKRTTH